MSKICDIVTFVHINKPSNKVMEEITNNIVANIVNNFDIPFCITVNIATYVLIKSFTDIKKGLKLTTWQKRLVFLFISIMIGIFYCVQGTNYRIILNSIILAPVSWSWIFKPICDKLGVDYTNKTIKD